MVTIYIVINYTHIMGIRVTISCWYCIVFEVMLLFSSYLLSLVQLPCKIIRSNHMMQSNY